jgi:hypothetical protein
MRQKYILCIIAFIVIIWLIYSSKKSEPFTPKIRAFYRPYVRNMNQYVDYAQNNYGLQFITNKLRKWNIY